MKLSPTSPTSPTSPLGALARFAALSAALCAVSTTTLGCYGSAPPHPPVVPLPPMDASSPIDVRSVTATRIENVDHQASSCPQGHGEGDPACVVTHYTVAEPVTRTTTTASYQGQPISYAQLAVMTDAKYDEKIAKLDELAHTCKRANIPRYTGIGLMVGGLIAGMLTPAGGKAIAYTGLGGGAVSYGVGFFAFGGKDCVRARMIHDSLDYTPEMSWTSVQGAEYAAQMKQLADDFNASHGGVARASGATRPEASPETIIEEPPPPPVARKAKRKPAGGGAAAKHGTLRMR